jgi:hypothetical protein
MIPFNVFADFIAKVGFPIAVASGVLIFTGYILLGLTKNIAQLTMLITEATLLLQDIHKNMIQANTQQTLIADRWETRWKEHRPFWCAPNQSSSQQHQGS